MASLFLVAYFFQMIINIGFTSFLTYYTFRHAIWLYQDLYTDERHSVDHRRNKPERTRLYKWVNSTTFGLMFASTFNNWSVIMFFLSPTQSACSAAGVVSVAGPFAKAIVPIVYSLRLHLVYRGSKYEYSLIKLKTIVVSTAIGFLFFSYFYVSYGFVGVKDKDGDGTYEADDPLFKGETWSLKFDDQNAWYYSICQLSFPAFYLLLYLFLDLGVNLGFMVAFIRPIRDVIRRVQGSRRDVMEKSKMSKKMLFVGFKVALLSTVVFLSSLVVMLIFMATTVLLFPTDYSINAICLALMTPYYEDDKYYQKLCCCCIKCCDRKGYTKGKHGEELPASSPRDPTVTDVQSDLETGSARSDGPSTGVSADTMSAVRLAAKDHQPVGDMGEDQETELATHLNPDNEN